MEDARAVASSAALQCRNGARVRKIKEYGNSIFYIPEGKIYFFSGLSRNSICEVHSLYNRSALLLGSGVKVCLENFSDEPVKLLNIGYCRDCAWCVQKKHKQCSPDALSEKCGGYCSK